MSSYELDIAASLGSGDLAKEYVRMRKQWSQEFSMEFITVCRKIKGLQEDVERLNRGVGDSLLVFAVCPLSIGSSSALSSECGLGAP